MARWPMQDSTTKRTQLNTVIIWAAITRGPTSVERNELSDARYLSVAAPSLRHGTDPIFRIDSVRGDLLQPRQLLTALRTQPKWPKTALPYISYCYIFYARQHANKFTSSLKIQLFIRLYEKVKDHFVQEYFDKTVSCN